MSSVCQATPTPGGTLVTARQNQTLSLSPYQTPGGWGDVEAQKLIFEGLVRFGPSGASESIVPAIADTWTEAADGLSYTFHIRDNAKFSNGDPVTAEDVKYTFDNWWSNAKASEWSAFSAGYKSTTVLDAHDVRIDLTATTGDFLYELAMSAGMILPENLVTSQGKAFFNNPVGSGPYELESWTKGSSMTFAKNPNYWQPGVPKLDKVVFNFVTTDTTRVLALKGGQAQTMDFVPWTDIASLQATSGFSVESHPLDSWILLSVNQQKPQFKDLNVRQALNTAIDRDAINKKIYSGLGTIPNSFLPQLSYDAPNSVVPPFSYDLGKAKQLMSSSGFPKGFSATLEFPSGSPAFQSLALVLQSEWAELGVQVTLRPEDQATLSKNFNGGTYDIMLPYATAASDVPVPDEFASFYALPGTTNGFFSWYKAPADLQKEITDFIGTPSDASRAAQWPKIQAELAAQLPAMNVLDLPLVNASANNVCDNGVDVVGDDTLLTTWVAK